MNKFVEGELKVCTVSSARHIQDFNAGAPTATVEVKSADCGKIIITDVRSPENINMARLAKVLNAHQGEKFEFILQYIQLDRNSLASYGVRSLEPVR